MALRYAAGGLLPASLLAWEMYAYATKSTKPKSKPPKLTEGSTNWLIEREVQTLDLVVFRRRVGPFGPCAALADYSAQSVDERAPYDGAGVVIVERDGVARVLRAEIDGAVSITSLATVLQETEDFAEVAIKPLVWPREDRDAIEGAARSFAGAAVLRCSEASRTPLDTLKDARVAPLVLPRSAWPKPRDKLPLRARLDESVSPAATLVLETLCHCNVVAPQFRDTATVPADFWNNAVPLRRGARYSPDRLDVKTANHAR